jgi:hypothetical protein
VDFYKHVTNDLVDDWKLNHENLIRLAIENLVKKFKDIPFPSWTNEVGDIFYIQADDDLYLSTRFILDAFNKPPKRWFIPCKDNCIMSSDNKDLLEYVARLISTEPGRVCSEVAFDSQEF